ncbi:Cof-type HAD-IIB family hydrolase [Listeria costaricensis]|uniref:Cof-type HAD-IIB family hydrolase n=1 Tax=Listeria costaricensis TaxID=2026604 RepID=UPI000C06E5F4|nr:Cof-type HAD-IIB family hydrolase [Listeria costaricensis]
MSKIVFFDIDGTLVNEEKEIPLSTVEAVKALQAKGIFVAIASGRAPFMLHEIAEKLQIDSFICYNGQYVVFEGKVIYENPLSQEALDRLITTTMKNDHPLVFSAAEEMRVNLPDHPGVLEGMNSLKRGYPRVDAHFYRGREIYQCLLFCTEDFDSFYAEAFPEYSFMRWHDVSVDVCPANGSKARGIRELIKQLGFKMEDTYAFGDGLNDIQMLQEVGTGIAMGNGRPELKKVADYITESVDEEGILKGLQHVGLL